MTAILLAAGSCMAQKNGDSKITITVSDTTHILDSVKAAFMRQGFTIKEIGLPDSVVTHQRELKSTSGVAVAFAKIEGNNVTIHGIYAHKIKDIAGLPVQTDKYKKIMYSKGSKLWPLMRAVANRLGTDHSYSR